MSALVDRRMVIELVGGTAIFGAMSSFAKAEALEHEMLSALNTADAPPSTAHAPAVPADGPRTVRAGAGRLFGDGRRLVEPLTTMPARPTLLDFFSHRFGAERQHCLQSAADALKKGEPETRILACLLHDVAQCLMCVDHGYWSAQMMAPYVSDRVSWAIRHHQALRFFPDESVGYEYPQHYVRLFGENHVPEPYIRQAYEHARGHRWYMDARMITVHDVYAFDPNVTISIDPFVDIIGRHFRQPKEGLGFDNSPVAHMWRSLIFADHPL